MSIGQLSKAGFEMGKNLAIKGFTGTVYLGRGVVTALGSGSSKVAGATTAIWNTIFPYLRQTVKTTTSPLVLASVGVIVGAFFLVPRIITIAKTYLTPPTQPDNRQHNDAEVSLEHAPSKV